MLQNVFSHRPPLYHLFDKAELRALHTPCYPPGSAVTLTFYRPQRSCGQGNIFTPVCHSVHRGGLTQCMLGCHQPPTKETPPGRRHPPLPRRTPPPRRDPPGRRHPPAKETPCQGDPPKETPSEADTSPGSIPLPGIRSMSGRYTSYWNALLFLMRSVKSLIRISVQSMLSGPFCFDKFVAITSMSALSLKTIKHFEICVLRYLITL